VCLIVLVLFLVSCVPPETEVEPVKIGASLTLTGFGAQWGSNAQKAIDMAVEEVNIAGGINGRPIEVIYEDFKEIDLKAAATAGIKLATVDQVDIILTQWAEDTEVIHPVAAENDILTIVVSSGAKGLPQKSPLLFRVWPSDEKLVKVRIDYALEQGVEKAAIISEQSSYFSTFRDIYVDVWKEKTGKDVFLQEISPDDTDFKTILSKIKERGSDVLFLEVNFNNAGLILKQAKELGITIMLIGTGGSDDPSLITVAGDAAEGLTYAEYKPAAPEFIEMFKEKYGVEPGIPADHAYDAIMILAKVMKEYGTNTEDIRQGLLSIEDFPGASGVISIDEHGDRSGKEIVLKRIENGKGVVISE